MSADQTPLLISDPLTYDYVFNGHAGAGPSSSERWMNCTGSLQASREFLETLSPEQAENFAVANVSARQGTTAHAAAESEALMLLGQIEQVEHEATLLELAINPDTEDEAYSEEMAEFITEYVDLVKTYAQDRGNDHILIEARVEAAVPLEEGIVEDDVYVIAGSADFIGLPTPEDPTLVVADLKYGSGVDVMVEQNSQARIYALGALTLLVDDEGELVTDIEEVVYHIVQPRLGGIKTWREPLDDLLTWRDEELAPSLGRALGGVAAGATFNPSEVACQWCPARGGCAALAESRIASASNLFDTIVAAEYEDGPGAFPETTTLPDDRLGELLTQITGLMDIHKDLKEEAQRRLLRGAPVPGFKLVSYTPPRKWSAEAAEVLTDSTELWKHSLVTPTQAIKVLGPDSAAIQDLIESPAKRPVIAPEGDRRKEWTGHDPTAMFDQIEEEK